MIFRFKEQWILTLVTVLLVFITPTIAGADSRLDEIRAAIEREGLSWTAGETSVSNLSTEEFRALLTLRAPPGLTPPDQKPQTLTDLPAVFDWREQAGVTPVKAQGNCGSCWAFSALAPLESQVLIHDGWSPDLSEQQLVSCDQFNMGCNGGWFTTAWDFLMGLGSDDETCMPYQATNSVPCIMKQCYPSVGIESWDYVGTSIDAIKTAVLEGPVACAMYVYDDFSAYTGGCYEHAGTTQNVNHGVTIVGWDDTVCDTGAWIVKNSWGPNFGIDGYCYIKFGTCNIGYGAAAVRRQQVPQTKLRFIEAAVIDANNSLPTAGEQCALAVTLENYGVAATGPFSALLTSDSLDVTVLRDTATFEDLGPRTAGSTVAPHFELKLSDNLPSLTKLDFQLTINGLEHQQVIPFSLIVGPVRVVYQTDFEDSDDASWTHGSTRGVDDWSRGGIEEGTIFDPYQAWSGTAAWGNKLTGNGNYRNNATNYLSSPVIDCSDCEGVVLRFRRWLTVERGRYDQATIKVNGEPIWENDYQEHLLDGSWVECIYDISDLASHQSEVTITFNLKTDEGLVFGGWNIDDLEILTAAQSVADDFDVALAANAAAFTAGDRFLLTYELTNNLTEVEYFEAILLEAFGSFYYKSFGQENCDHRDVCPPMHSEDRLSH